MSFSYWEHDTWFSNIDFTIAGSGITGLNCALKLHKRFPRAKILILERGLLPNGASTKNAGFATLGSISEILDDLNTHSEEEVLELVKKRVKGLKQLRENLGDDNIDYREYGGYELFTEENKELFEECEYKLPDVNRLLKPLFGEDVFSLKNDTFGFRNIQPQLVYSKFEGQLDTGKMMKRLLQKVHSAGIQILNNVEVRSFSDEAGGVRIETDKFSIYSGKFLIATNGFSAQLGLSEVKPARAQVLITNPIPGLNIKGTFHLDRGFYYFRNVGERLLFGGGRNLNFKAEETTEIELTELVQDRLEVLLQNVIWPDQSWSIERRWSGIMGVGSQKKPILKQLSNNVYCGVRLGGMGVAIGSLVGKELAELID